MTKRIAKKATALILTVLMLVSMASPAFAIEPVEDLPINMEDSSSNSSSGSVSEDISDTTSDLISSDTGSENTSSDTSSNETAEDEEFKVLPFPWQNTMVDADGNEIDSTRAAQAVIECSWMKYKNPAMADKGEIPWLLVTIGGKVAYCVDTFNHSTNGGTSFVEKTDYNKLSTGQKDTIAYIMRYGAKTIAQDTDNILLHMATQTLIWEVVDGDRAPYTLAGSGGGVYQDLVKRYPNIASKYNSIIANARTWGEIPSFAKRTELLAPTHKLEGTGPYTAALTNTNANCDMSLFKFTLPGITSSISGNTLNVSSTLELTSTVTAKAERKDATAGDSFIFWFDPSGTDQTRTSPGIDPVPAYFKLSNKDAETPPPDEPEPDYYIEITKLQEGTDIPLSGAQFEVRYLGGNGEIIIIPPAPVDPDNPDAEPPALPPITEPEHHFVTTVTSGADGKIKVKVPYSGVYQITEQVAPANHKLADEKVQTVTVNKDTPNGTAQVTYHNEPYTGVSIKKIDAQTKVALAGATFKLEQIDGSIIRTGITDANGILTFNDIPAASYRVTEITPPPNYHIAVMPIQTVELKANQTATLVFEDEPYSGFKIRKVDAHTGKGLAGAVFTIHIKDGALIGEYITDINGLIIKGDLPEGWYTITEKQPPEGYLLEEGNSTRDIYIRPNDDIEVVFRDFAKPKLLIQKVDELTGKPLVGATFRIAPKDGVDFTEVTTGADGTALVENLNVDWYVVTEIRSPNGYLLDDTPHLVQLEAGKTTRLEITNQKKPSLKILKLDSITKQPLQFAEFNIKEKNGKDLGNFITDKNGEIRLENVKPTLYVVTEISAPNGYLLITTPTEILVEWGKVSVITLENTPQHPLMIKKVDSKTGEALAGAKFIITKVSGEAVGEFETGRNGYVTVTGIEPGFYTVKEIKAPDGYILNGTPKIVELKRGVPAVVEFENEAKQSLMIKKIDSKTGQALAGAKFSIEKLNGAALGEYETDSSGSITITDVEPGFYTIKEIKAPDGYILNSSPKVVELKKDTPMVVEFENDAKQSLMIKKIDSKTGQALAGAKFSIEKLNGATLGEYVTDISGSITITGVEPGFYTIKEIRAPDGYILNSSPKVVELKKDTPLVVEFENEAKQSLMIKKIDSKTGQPLAGAKFTIDKLNGATLGEYETAMNGYITLVDVEPGFYTIKEIKAPDGYILNSSPKVVELKKDTPLVVEFENEAKQSLMIKKVDSKTGEALLGAKFVVQKVSGENIGEYDTDRNGYVTITGLEPGFYTIKEIKAPNGYILNGTPKIVELKKDSPAVIEFENTPLQGLSIRKVDNVTGEPLSGVQFFIQEMNGAPVGTFTTDNTGTLFVPNLKEGWYTVTETKVPEGYKIDNVPRNIEIKADRLNVLEYRNNPYPILSILKIDSESKHPLEGAKFKLSDKYGRELGTYTTNKAGKITLTGIDAGKYSIQEVEAPEGYVLDGKIHDVTLEWGRTTVVELENTPKASFRLIKIDSVTGKRIYGVSFLLYDNKNNVIGEYTTDQNGTIYFPKNLSAGRYKVKEIKAADGYVLDDTVRTIELKSGETTEIVVENEPLKGRIQIVKKSESYNDITKKKAGSLLSGAVFEISDSSNNVVDRIKTDRRGVATSKLLPLGKYAIREVKAPEHYLLDGKVFYAEIKVHNDLIKFVVLNDNEETKVTVEKFGNIEAMPGDIIRYDFKNISNQSNVELDEFYFHDAIPTDAVRLQELKTGTWNEHLSYTVLYKTNIHDYRMLKDDLSSNINYTLDCRREALGLNSYEYITDIKFEFGTVQAGFKEKTSPEFFCMVNGDLPNEYRFKNCADVGGKRFDEWITDKDCFVTVIYDKPKGKLPKTGF